MKYIIGNWKSNKNNAEVESWFGEFSKTYEKLNRPRFDNLQIIICPPFVYLPESKKYLEKFSLPIYLGAQDISPFPQGAYTGEITGKMISDYAEYVLIGHSERRKYFSETDSLLREKVNMATASGLKPVFCIPDKDTEIPENVTIAAYEPVFAIGTGQADNPQSANNVAKSVKDTRKASVVIYGGSVTPENIRQFLTAGDIDGVLPGKASLDPVVFWEMIRNAPLS